MQQREWKYFQEFFFLFFLPSFCLACWVPPAPLLAMLEHPEQANRCVAACLQGPRRASIPWEGATGLLPPPCSSGGGSPGHISGAHSASGAPLRGVGGKPAISRGSRHQPGAGDQISPTALHLQLWLASAPVLSSFPLPGPRAGLRRLRRHGRSLGPQPVRWGAPKPPPAPAAEAVLLQLCSLLALFPPGPG